MRHRIGVIDSGMGGLTLVKQLYGSHVPVDIVYVGDNANVPYGNRPSGEIVSLTRRMLDVLEEQEVEAVAIACNTISATADLLAPLCSFPLVDIISPAAKAAAERGEPYIGLFATAFTVASGLHQKLINRINPSVQVLGVASKRLAALIESLEWSEQEISAEIQSMAEQLREMGQVSTVILGCTHYPIALDIFRTIAPEWQYLDPAEYQMKKLLEHLHIDISNHEQTLDNPKLSIVTSGEPEAYHRMLSRLGIPPAEHIAQLS